MPGRDLTHDDSAQRDILTAIQLIAVVGASMNPSRAAHGVMRYLIGRGYVCLPINPNYSNVLGQPCLPHLADLSAPVDLIDVFRNRAEIPGLTAEILALPWKPRLVFLQEGLSDAVSMAKLHEAGIDTIEDRCLYKEHWRLIGFHAPLPDAR